MAKLATFLRLLVYIQRRCTRILARSENSRRRLVLTTSNRFKPPQIFRQLTIYRPLSIAHAQPSNSRTSRMPGSASRPFLCLFLLDRVLENHNISLN